MSEAEAGTPADETPAEPPKKKLNLRPKTRAALVEILERERQRLPLHYKAVAMRHDVSPRSLKTIVSRYRSGEVSLGIPESAQDLQIDFKTELQRTMRVLDELESMLNDSLEGMLARAKKYGAQGKLLAYRDMGIPFVLADLKTVSALRGLKQGQFIKLVQAAQREKQVKDAVDVPSEVITSHDDSQLAYEALARAAAAGPAGT